MLLVMFIHEGIFGQRDLASLNVKIYLPKSTLVKGFGRWRAF